MLPCIRCGELFEANTDDDYLCTQCEEEIEVIINKLDEESGVIKTLRSRG
jgi:DNA-directed RNA polymerase subunit RPC12/RpoP